MVLYDNACGIRRFMKRRIERFQEAGVPVPACWLAVAALMWVIDRLHYRYHRGCRVEGKWKVDGVSPAEYDCLRGVNTQANEQVFSMIDRWSKTLNATAPTHHHLLLLLFAHDHNKRINPDTAFKRYEALRRNAGQWVEPPLPDPKMHDEEVSGDDRYEGALVKRGPKRAKPLKLLSSECAEPTGTKRPGAGVQVEFAWDDQVVAHPMSHRVHRPHADYPGLGTQCGLWWFNDDRLVRTVCDLLHDGDIPYVTCGICRVGIISQMWQNKNKKLHHSTCSVGSQILVTKIKWSHWPSNHKEHRTMRNSKKWQQWSNGAKMAQCWCRYITIMKIKEETKDIE